MLTQPRLVVRVLGRIAIVFLTLGQSQLIYAALTPISAVIDVMAEADAGSNMTVNTSRDSQATALLPLSATASAESIVGPGRAFTQTTISATWNDAASGQVLLTTEWEWEATGGLPGTRVATGSQGWQYQFTSDRDSLFILDFELLHAGSFAFGMRPGLQFTTGPLATESFPIAPSSGTLVRQVLAGEIYLAQIFDNSNLNNLPGNFSSELNARFDWRIVDNAVPEPLTATLGLMSLGVLGLATRRRAA